MQAAADLLEKHGVERVVVTKTGLTPPEVAFFHGLPAGGGYRVALLLSPSEPIQVSDIKVKANDVTRVFIEIDNP